MLFAPNVINVQRKLLIAGGWIVVAMLLFVAGVFYWKTPDGRIVRIESNDPSIKLGFEDDELQVTGAYDKPLRLKPGKVKLKITKPLAEGKELEFESDKLVIRNGDRISLMIEVLDSEVRIVQDGKGVIDAMPLVAPAEQYEALVDAMRLANPGFDGAMVPRFENGHLVSIDFKTDNVTDISPLRNLKRSESLANGRQWIAGARSCRPIADSRFADNGTLHLQQRSTSRPIAAQRNAASNIAYRWMRHCGFQSPCRDAT